MVIFTTNFIKFWYIIKIIGVKLMGKNKAIDRLAFLSKKFNIFNLKNDYTETDLNEITSHSNFKLIKGHNNNILSLRCVYEIKKLRNTLELN